MKYYLIIGYQLLEKYKEFPSVRVYINQQLVDEFKCDSEQTTKISAKTSVLPDDFMRLTFDEKGRKFKDTISKNYEKPDGVIISAKAGTGIDLKGDLSRFQIIIKAPYMSELQDETDMRAKKIMKFDKERFFMKSLFRLIQFAGRSVRGITDHAETYVLDTAGPNMVKIQHQKGYAPDWFFEACRFDAKLN